MTKITMLCGLPGSGKSTWANQNKRENTIVLSSDKIREELFGAEEIQGNPKQVFNLLYKRAEEALEQEKNVIIDSTNLSRANRKKFIKRFYSLADYLSIIIFLESAEECIERQKKRDRKVPASVIRRMAQQMEMPTFDEGWDEIKIM
jgi:predicted kinase